MFKSLTTRYPWFHNPRVILLLIAGSAGGLIVFALLLVQFTDLVPCPLCIVQRFFYGFVGLAALTSVIRSWPHLSERVAGALVSIFALAGWLVAFRHVLLQRFPQVESANSGCAVSFGSFLDDVIMALGGTGNCARVDWTLLGLALPEWSLIAFTGYIAAGVWVFLMSQKSIDARPSSE